MDDNYIYEPRPQSVKAIKYEFEKNESDMLDFIHSVLNIPKEKLSGYATTVRRTFYIVIEKQSILVVDDGYYLVFRDEDYFAAIPAYDFELMFEKKE